ncbi:hypothetical protein BD626DRAFT_406213 [Schizophyllum amplum]|uniref:Uncharacterized protein n=1 Tax=Schizophyllum amplum TaxID=97359 RepID=A0A550C8N1_9AGAR|nr:hypothetical protein BD626DRAFT_406213 [Auriculariopsis ampla]
MPSPSRITSRAAQTIALLLNTPLVDEKQMELEVPMQDMSHLRARSLELSRSRPMSIDTIESDTGSEASYPSSPMSATIEAPVPAPQKRHKSWFMV